MKISLKNCQRILEQFLPDLTLDPLHQQVILLGITKGIEKANLQLADLLPENTDTKNVEYITTLTFGLFQSLPVKFIFKIKYKKIHWHLKWITKYENVKHGTILNKGDDKLYLPRHLHDIAFQTYTLKYEILPPLSYKPIPTCDKGSK